MSEIAVVSVHAVALQLPLDVGEHPAVCDRQRREVHRHARVSPGELASHQCQHLAHDRAVDLLDQAVALGGGQEAHGRRKGATRIISEADQRLVVTGRTVLQRDDRLIVQDEQILT
jgi:anti-sigma factor ChrR (cupin superfamily)